MTITFNPIQQSIDTLIKSFMNHARTVDSLICPSENMTLSRSNFKSSHVITLRGPMRCGMTQYLLDWFEKNDDSCILSPNIEFYDRFSIGGDAINRSFLVNNPASYGRVARKILLTKKKPRLVLVDNYLDVCGKDSALDTLADSVYDEATARNQFIIALSTR